MTERIPSHVVENGLILAENARYLGRPLSELTKEELLACAAIGWDAYTRLLNANLATKDAEKVGRVTRTIE